MLVILAEKLGIAEDILIHFEKYDNAFILINGCLILWSNSLLVSALDLQSRGSNVKTTGWLQSQFNVLSFQCQSNEYQDLLKTYW